jgi:hypothetical protein
MVSKYQGLSADELEKRLRLTRADIDMYKNMRGMNISDGFRVSVQKMIMRLESSALELEELLKPKIDYEDGTWV